MSPYRRRQLETGRQKEREIVRNNDTKQREAGSEETETRAAGVSFSGRRASGEKSKCARRSAATANVEGKKRKKRETTEGEEKS